jgi:hypothetical protein
MNFKEFKAGRWVQQYEQRSFSPAPVNHEWIWEDPRINTLLEEATRAIGELNAFSLNILKKWEKMGRSQLYVFGRYLALFLERSI